MAERNYTITLELSNVEGKSPVAGDNSKSDTAQMSTANAQMAGVKGALAVTAVQVAKNTAISIVNAEVSRVQLKTGSNELQVRANYINSVVQKTVGFVGNVGSAAIMGGPYAAIAAAVVSVAAETVSFAQKVQTYSKISKNL